MRVLCCAKLSELDTHAFSHPPLQSPARRCLEARSRRSRSLGARSPHAARGPRRACARALRALRRHLIARRRRLDAHHSSSALQALLASVLILSAPLLAPDEALAARSSGRVGGSSFRSAPRAAPRSAPRASATARASTNVYVAPPLGGYGYGGYGYGGLGGFGLGMPPVVIAGGPVVGYGGGFSLLGSLFQFFAIAAIFQLLLSQFTNLGRRKEEGEDEEDTL